MPIHFLSEASQESTLNEFNQSKKRTEKIPLVARNANSGWPLLQVSLLSPSEANSQRYEHVLGGGKCHYFYIGAFNLACLLAKIPGPMHVTGNYGKNGKREHLKADNVGMFLEHFHIEHKSLGFTIGSESGAYGKTLSVSCPEGTPENLRQALYEPFSFAMNPRSRIREIGGWKDEPAFTIEQLNANINKEVAVFAEGQIFVDLGEFLDKQVKDPAIKEMFAAIFKVNEFCELQEHKEELLAKENPETDVLSQVQDNSVPSFTGLLSKIAVLKTYGKTLSQDKNDAVIELGQSLEQRISNFKLGIANRQPSQNEIQTFQSELTILLHSKDNEMKDHRKIWKPIIANIAFSIATVGIGLLAIGIKAAINAVHAYRNDKSLGASDLLFFAQTTREKMLEDIEQDLQSPTTYTNQNQN